MLAERLGIDPGAMAHRRCAACKSKEQCQRVIREGRALVSAVASFCPSAEVLWPTVNCDFRPALPFRIDLIRC
jgi:hypothetical protein